MRKKVSISLGAMLAVALILVSCTGSAGPQGERGPAGPPGPQGEKSLTRTTGAPVVSVQAVPAPPEYDPVAAHLEGYWYSRYDLSHLVMRSGMGVPFMPPMEKVQQMMEMAGITEGPANPHLVQALFTSGDPHFVQQFNGDENDFSNFRWDTANMDNTVSPQAMGYTMIKEVIWAKSFASDVEGPNPMNHFRALVLSAEAASQAQFALTNLKAPNGLFVSGWRDGQITNATIAARDQVVMLWAFSELADYATGRYGWYAAPLSYNQAQGIADDLLAAMVEHTMVTPRFLLDLPSRDLGIAISALSSYASYTQDEAKKTLVLEDLLPSLASELMGRMNEQGKLLADGEYNQVATQGAGINGLVFAYKATGDGRYRDEALRAWRYLETLWDETAGIYATEQGAPRYVYSVRDVADVVGALNALLYGLNEDVDQRFADFFNGVVNRSGLQIAEGTPTGGGQDEDTIPDPFHAGGDYGQAPVLATEAVYDTLSGQWHITDPRFTTAYAMAAASQFMWIGSWAGQASVPGHGIPNMVEE